MATPISRSLRSVFPFRSVERIAILAARVPGKNPKSNGNTMPAGIDDFRQNRPSWESYEYLLRQPFRRFHDHLRLATLVERVEIFEIPQHTKGIAPAGSRMWAPSHTTLTIPAFLK